MDVDVVTVTYNSAATLRECLGSVCGLPAVRGVIVVDNASGDESVAVATSVGATVVIQNDRNLGFAAAVNVGLGQCAADYVLLLNPDATIDRASLGSLCTLLSERPDAVMVGPALKSGGGVVLGARRFARPWARAGIQFPLLRRLVARLSVEEYPSAERWLADGQPREVDYVWGAACLIRRAFLVAVGGLDERYFMYCEDEDLGRTARRLGRSVILAPGVAANHLGGASTQPIASRAAAWHVVSLERLFAKWHSKRTATAYGILARTGYLLQLSSARVRGRTAEEHFAREVLLALREHRVHPWRPGA